MGYQGFVIGLRIVFGQVIASLRHRAGRHAMTVFGVLLGSSFYAAISSYRYAILQTTSQPEAEAQLRWFAYVGLSIMLAGLANTMLISVSERFREIGTLKCLGASDATVLSITLVECAFLAVLGASAGVPAGTWIGARIAGSQPFWLSVPNMFGTALAVCMVASLVPALAASRIPAAAALRSEF